MKYCNKRWVRGTGAPALARFRVNEQQCGTRSRAVRSKTGELRQAAPIKGDQETSTSPTKIRAYCLSPSALQQILVDDGYNIGAWLQPRCWRICCFLLSHALGIGRVSFVLCCTQPMTLFPCFKRCAAPWLDLKKSLGAV
ncbi:hypothetical protein V8C44DRAFT_343373 [Trichoderma aethiopicum]